MKFVVGTPKTRVFKKVGPMCLACGNTRTFWVDMPGGEVLVEMRTVREGEIRVTACGRCSSRNSIVVGHVD